MSSVIIIPVFEPDVKIIEVINKLLVSTDLPLCIVDDGSQDKHIFKDPIFLNKRIILLQHAVNMGKGAALKTAFNYILNQYPDLKGVVTLDADGQHAVPDVIKLIENVRITNDLVLGVRSFSLFDKAIPLKSRIGNVFTRLVWRFLIGSKVTDTQTGLRGIPVSLMKKCLNILSNRYEFETEMLLMAKQMNLPLKEVSINTIYIDQNRGTHFNPFTDSFKIYFVLFMFSCSSFVSTFVDYLSFYLLMSTLNVGTSFIFARLISFGVNYNLNKNFVFRSAKDGKKSFFKYLLLFSFNLLVGYYFIEYVSLQGMPKMVSKITVDIFLFLLNFVVQREFVFKPQTRSL